MLDISTIGYDLINIVSHNRLSVAEYDIVAISEEEVMKVMGGEEDKQGTSIFHKLFKKNKGTSKEWRQHNKTDEANKAKSLKMGDLVSVNKDSPKLKYYPQKMQMELIKFSARVNYIDDEGDVHLTRTIYGINIWKEQDLVKIDN